MFPVLVVAALAAPVVAAVAGVGLAVRHFEDEHAIMQEMKRWSRDRGFTFQPQWHTMATELQKDIPDISEAWAGFRGELPEGRDLFGAALTWQTGSGKSRTSHRRHVCGVRMEGVDFPMLAVHRRWRPRVMRPVVLRSHVLQVEHVGFSRRWEVRCRSPRLAHDLLHPRVVETLMGAPGWLDAVWFSGDTLIAAGRRGTPERNDEALDLLSRLATLVPTFVAEELGDGSAGVLYGGGEH